MKSRTVTETTFDTHDGAKLFYRHWPALTDNPRGAIVLLHRGHEHSGRVAHLVGELNLPEFSFFAWDARGHGLSSGERGFSPSAATSVRDVKSFVDHITCTHDVSSGDIVVIGQSIGAVLAAAWVHDYAPNIRALVLAAPAFSVNLRIPLALPALRLKHAVGGNFFVKSYVKVKQLTHDRNRIASYNNDPLISRPISSTMLLDLHDLSARLVDDAAAITVPTQLLIPGKDRIVDQAPQHRFYERLGAPVKERHVFPGHLHDILGEKDRRPVIECTRAFVLANFDKPTAPPSLLDADKHGPTCRDVDRLRAPLPTLSAKGLYWSSLRLALRLGGWLSKGLRIGRRYGFNSGTMLDYVYQNRPKGLTPLGRALDRAYLNAVGWKGIRQRKPHLEELLRSAIERVREAGEPLHILDIAAGRGRYVLDVVEAIEPRPQSVMLRDISDVNVEAATQSIAHRRLSDIVTFTKGDAFDTDGIAAIEPHPTVAIVSGLYELIPDNAPVRASLEGLGRAVRDGGYLIYTGQPWHPQLEMIARTLTDHKHGAPWIMRCRTQVELDQLVAAAGFKKIDQRVDAWGIFTVSLAQKVTS